MYVYTGVRSGIGKTLVEAFGKDVVTVITGRSEAKLKKVQDELNSNGYHIENQGL